jgi:hypothetical protein
MQVQGHATYKITFRCLLPFLLGINAGTTKILGDWVDCLSRQKYIKFLISRLDSLSPSSREYCRRALRVVSGFGIWVRDSCCQVFVAVIQPELFYNHSAKGYIGKKVKLISCVSKDGGAIKSIQVPRCHQSHISVSVSNI